jgi:hypothetical protein
MANASSFFFPKLAQLCITIVVLLKEVVKRMVQQEGGSSVAPVFLTEVGRR